MGTGRQVGHMFFAVLTLGVLSLSAQAEFRDFTTQRAGMHACRQPGFMTGVHIDQNVLLCDDTLVSNEQFEEREEVVDGDTQQGSMHVCPDQMAMTGYHKHHNQLLCAKVGPTWDFLDINGVTQRTIGGIRMHACPVGTVMRGIHADRNDFMCAVAWDKCTPEFPCPAGHGDCDTDADCQGETRCRHNIGGTRGLHPAVDICE
jgi:hypothetical protein